ncbi:uncharacterized protein LOC112599750 [Melanaphis sacchari]|uniref:uncharacterized protein LOC112599750 n=1 Tax=Melanaphis sacchari TaxID=742174 RepID=UPI000DC13C88|nr:uncharacterized protein LOC112599750 [Melanaphis sacchari]XP_025202593.1 uncharacterized protein LOC112599750 [Melanaphis sacchari]
MHSQRWMFTSPGGENEYKKPSVTRAHYDAVFEAKKMQEKNHIETESERKRRMLEDFMWQQMTKRTLDQIEKQQRCANETKACSTYAESFVLPGFKVKELGFEIDEELQQKYPLYTDMAKSSNVRDLDTIKAKNPIHKSYTKLFRKDSRFTSRLSNPMDIHAPVEPGHFAYI